MSSEIVYGSPITLTGVSFVASPPSGDMGLAAIEWPAGMTSVTFSVQTLKASGAYGIPRDIETNAQLLQSASLTAGSQQHAKATLTAQLPGPVTITTNANDSGQVVRVGWRRWE